MRITPFADGYLNITGLNRAQRMSVSNQLRALGVFQEIVPGKQDVSVQFDPLGLSTSRAIEAIEAVVRNGEMESESPARPIVLPVAYGGEYGPDLDFVSQLLGLAAEAIIDEHIGATYRVDFMGFTPGFAYLSGLPDCLTVPRLEHPKQSLVAGSVGIAAGQCGLYALDGPGGWPIIGRVLTPLFDARSKRPFALSAGVEVSFERVLP